MIKKFLAPVTLDPEALSCWPDQIAVEPRTCSLTRYSNRVSPELPMDLYPSLSRGVPFSTFMESRPRNSTDLTFSWEPRGRIIYLFNFFIPVKFAFATQEKLSSESFEDIHTGWKSISSSRGIIDTRVWSRISWGGGKGLPWRRGEGGFRKCWFDSLSEPERGAGRVHFILILLIASKCFIFFDVWFISPKNVFF